MLQMTRPAGRPKSDSVPLLGWFSAIRVMFSSPNTAIIIRRVYDTIHMGLWALLVAGTVFLLLQIPRMQEARAIAEAQRLQQIAEENRSYCEKWGMRAGSHEHVICTMDLSHIRKEVEQRIADESNF
jgi:uncharacterized membrane protein